MSAGTPGLPALATAAPLADADELLGRYIMQTYARPEMVFTHAEGVRMYDAFGKEYLDFAGGIAVNALGAHITCLPPDAACAVAR